jgi:hypothetical protein
MVCVFGNDRHVLTPAMITGVYDVGIEVLVIGIGVDGALACPEDVKRSIRDQGIARVEPRRTPEVELQDLLGENASPQRRP